MGRTLSTVFGVMLLAPLVSKISAAESTLTIGVTGVDPTTPFIEIKFKDAWTPDVWGLSFELDGRAEFTDTLGDADLSVIAHADRLLSPDLKIALDASYDFDRERTSAIKQFHKLTGDIGFETSFEQLILNADAGLVSRIYEDTTQAGFPPLDRKREDLFDTEASLRFTFAPQASIKPFLETALVARTYKINTGRDFLGPDVIAGITLADENVKGDVGVTWLNRALQNSSTTYAIGPSVDVEWTYDETSKLSLALSVGIDQDTAGPKDLFRYTSARLEVSHALADRVVLTAGSDVLYEDRMSGYELEINPSLKLDWSVNDTVGIFGTAGLAYSKTKGNAAELEPKFELGMKVKR